MNNRITIQEELKALNSELPLEKGPEVYSVPKGYFKGFAALMLQRIKAEQANSASNEISALSPLLAGLSKKMPYSIPENYFSKNTEELNELVSEEVLPAILHDLKAMPYDVPVGYFENLPELILKKVNPKQAKVISINSSRKWMRYAVAAVITGAIAISSIFYFGNDKSVDPASQPHEWVAKKLKNVPDKELDEFINTADVNTTAIAKSEINEKTEVRKLVKDIPDSDLDKFLDEVSVEEDLSLIN
jgi:hypothetical protein